MTYIFIEYTGRIDFESVRNDFLFGRIVFQFGRKGFGRTEFRAKTVNQCAHQTKMAIKTSQTSVFYILRCVNILKEWQGIM